jgi:hypothetical protein
MEDNIKMDKKDVKRCTTFNWLIQCPVKGFMNMVMNLQ